MRMALEIRIAGVNAAIALVQKQLEESDDRTEKAFLQGLLAGYEKHLNALTELLEITKNEEEYTYEVI